MSTTKAMVLIALIGCTSFHMAKGSRGWGWLVWLMFLIA